MFKRKRSKSGYWFTIVAANNQVLATSETYTTAAMRDKGIEAVKRVVWNIVSVKDAAKRAGEEARFSSLSTVQFKDDKVKFPRPSGDTFHLENAKGKIKKH